MKLQGRRELIMQRKQLKKQQELEAKKLEEQLSILKEEDEEKAKIAQGYLKNMFKQADDLMMKRSEANLLDQPDVAKVS